MSKRVIAYLILLFLISVLGGIKYKKLSAPFKTLVILVLVSLISECASKFLGIKFKNGCAPYHVYCVLEYICFVFMYAGFFPSQATKDLLKSSALIIVIVSCINTLFFQRPSAVPTNIISLTHLIYVFCSLYLFREILRTSFEINIFKQPVFWVNCNVLVYNAAFLLIWPFYNYFKKADVSTGVLDTINYVNNIFYYSVFGIVILLNHSPKDHFSNERI